jgi:hypothetical protein
MEVKEQDDDMTILDRSVEIILPPTETTPSTRNWGFGGVSAELERLHRLHGTAVLAHAMYLLRSSPSTFPTACTIFHRFYHRCSIKQYDVWSVGLGCTMLACKIEEDMRPAHDVILVFVQIYRRFRLGVSFNEQDHSSTMVAGFKSRRSDIVHNQNMTEEEKRNILRYIKPLRKNGPIYEEWRDTLESMENIILKELGFTLYWIPSSHPHNFLLYFIRVLEIEEEKTIGQTSWSFCNDACRLDLSVRYEPEVIVCFKCCVLFNISSFLELTFWKGLCIHTSSCFTSKCSPSIFSSTLVVCFLGPKK